MKALILAGGTGSRLRPITHTAAKQLVPVANKPILYYVLEAVVAAGITDIGMVVGDTRREIEAAIGDGSRFGADVTYLPQDRPLGLAHAVLVSRDFLGDDDFVMYLGDNILTGGLDDVVRGFEEDPADAHILLTKVADPSAFGVVELDVEGRVTRLEEKPQDPRSDLALVGVYVFTPAVHEAVRAISPSARGELEITDALQWLIDRGRNVRPTMVTGYWKDTGNVADMLEVNRSLLETLSPAVHGSVDDASELVGPVRIEAGAQVRRSRIVGPVAIGPGTVVTDSCLGPFTSIADDCRIADSTVEFSIVLNRAGIEGVGGVEASLIGRDARVRSACRAQRAHRLVLGDHSDVQIASCTTHPGTCA